ncbi:MAG: SPFH domain-containing protein [Solirubrobacterales bacterium]
MKTFSDLIQSALEWGLELLPFTVVEIYEQGVRIRLGKPIGRVEPGLRWYWPLLEEVVTYTTVTRVIELDNQTIQLPSGEVLTFSLSVRYRVVDALLMHTLIYDPHSTLADAVRTIAGHEASVLTPPLRGTLFSARVADAAVAEMEPWGVEVEDVGVTNFAVTPVLRLMVDNLSGGTFADND